MLAHVSLFVTFSVVGGLLAPTAVKMGRNSNGSTTICARCEARLKQMAICNFPQSLPLRLPFEHTDTVIHTRGNCDAGGAKKRDDSRWSVHHGRPSNRDSRKIHMPNTCAEATRTSHLKKLAFCRSALTLSRSSRRLSLALAHCTLCCGMSITLATFDECVCVCVCIMQSIATHMHTKYVPFN